MHKRTVVQYACSVSAVVVFVALPVHAGSGASNPSQQSEQKSREQTGSTVPRPDDCAKIKAGAEGGTAESAARKDCESSKHLGGGTGTSSGTGSGKMAPGSGTR